MKQSGENIRISEIGGEQIAYPESLREVGKFFLKNCDSVEEAVEGAACVAGVYADVKPAGVVTNAWMGEQGQQDFEHNLQELGINYVVRDISQGGYQQYFVSKDLSKAEELERVFGQLWNGEPVDKKLGQLLGYPETAVNYVVNGGKDEKRASDTLIVHSPEHFQDEHDAYEGILYGILNEACPELMEAKRRNEKRKIGKRIFGIFKL